MLKVEQIGTKVKSGKLGRSFLCSEMVVAQARVEK